MALAGGVSLAQTPTESANILAGTSGLTLTDAMRILVAQKQAAVFPPHGSYMPGVITFVAEDMGKGWSPRTGTWVNSMLDNGLVGGINVEMQQALVEDTTLYLSVWDMQALKKRGWGMGTAGYDEIPGLYGSGGYYSSSLLSKGYTDAQEDSFYNNVKRGVDLQIQYGLGQPRWASPSLESNTWITAKALADNGIEYFFVGPTNATGTNSFGAKTGLNTIATIPYNLRQARWGMWHTGGSGVFETNETVRRGYRMDPYAIYTAQLGGKTLAQWKAQLDHAAQVGGLAIWLHHNASLIEGETGITFDSLCTWIKERYLDTGLLISLEPGAAMDYFEKRPISSITSFNYGPECFNDIDNDGYVDGWGTGNGTIGQPADTALIKRWSTPHVGHDGGKAYSLNWGNAIAPPSGQVMIGGLAQNEPWESTRLYYGVIPPQGGGWTCRFEFWYAADSVGASWSGVSGDTIGVTFYGAMEEFTNRHGSADTYPAFWFNNNNYAPMVSSHSYRAGGLGGNFARFGSFNRFTDPGFTWGCLRATWDVPEFVDYLFIAIWKGPTIPANGVVISDYRVTFFRRDPAMEN